jgi:hypothetical protein
MRILSSEVSQRTSPAATMRSIWSRLTGRSSTTVLVSGSTSRIEVTQTSASPLISTRTSWFFSEIWRSSATISLRDSTS